MGLRPAKQITLESVTPHADQRIVLPLGSFSVRETLNFSQEGRIHLLTPMEVEASGCDYEIARYHDQQSPA